MAEDDMSGNDGLSERDEIIADEAFDLPIFEDDDSYIQEYIDDCPEHGEVIPISLPYRKGESDSIEGFHLVCPRCRYVFGDYEVDNQQWNVR